MVWSSSQIKNFKKKLTENYLTSNCFWSLSGFSMLHWSFWHIWIFDLRAQNKDFFKNLENQNFRFSAGKIVGREKYFLKKNISLLYITKKNLVWMSCLMMKGETRTFRRFFVPSRYMGKWYMIHGVWHQLVRNWHMIHGVWHCRSEIDTNANYNPV